MPEPTIVNIINFIRACEPRVEMDLVEPVVEQLRLAREYGFPVTWLLQYDALIDERFTGLLRELDETHEVGVWFEVVQAQAERAGIPWRGRFPWDWHSHVDYPIGYPPAERERLADVLMEQCKAVFGRYPRSVGSWVLDAHTLGYLADCYGIIAACNCKDQWGTDGYTLWGGYFNQAYYPSRLNAYMPAQHAERQIPVPVFRMLGSDPIYQYEDGSSGTGQGVVSLEPVYASGAGGGGVPRWVRWFFDTMTAGPNLSFGYTQMGQENSFGWPAMAAGLTDQFAHLAELRDSGTARVQTLAESGAWYRARYPVTPASAVTALTDWKGEGRRAVWYCSRHYRASLAWEGEHFRIRDLHLFDETYPERYLTAVCPGHACAYDTLPIMEGFLWSDAETRAGAYPVNASGERLPGGEPSVSAASEDELRVSWPLRDGHTLDMQLMPDRVAVTSDRPDWALRFTWGETKGPKIVQASAHAVDLQYEGHRYRLACGPGRFALDDRQRLLIEPEGGRIELCCTARP